MKKSAQYLSALDMPPGHYVFYRKTEDVEGIAFDIWNSKTKAWKPSATACDAFIGLDAFGNAIAEEEVLRVIEQFS